MAEVGHSDGGPELSSDANAEESRLQGGGRDLDRHLRLNNKGSLSRDGDSTVANGENASDADVSSLSSLDGLDESRLPGVENLKSLVSGYRRLQSGGSTLEERQSSVSSCEGERSPRDGAMQADLRPPDGEGAAPGKTSAATSPEAILHLNGVKSPGFNDNCKPYPIEDTHEFNSNSAAAVTCELKTEGAHPFARLQEELRKAREELKVKDEEVGRLKCLRDEVGAELEDLTASLFQEAHKMVREAKVKRDAAEKALKEANMKIEVLQAEVQALKALVITSTPSMPNRHLHPQLDSKGVVTKKENGEKNGANFFKGHKRSPSHNNLKYGRETTPPGSPVRELPPEPLQREEYEVDPVYHHEFVSWKENPGLDKEHPFLERIYREDIMPCLNFTNTELAKIVQKCIEENSIVIETVSGKSPFPKRCAMLDTPRLCKYRMKLGDSDQWHYISELCRNRIAATCNFLSYLRYIQQGLVKSSIHEVYGEILHLRKQIAVAKLGFK